MWGMLSWTILALKDYCEFVAQAVEAEKFNNKQNFSLVCLKSSFNSLQIEWEGLICFDHMRVWKLSTKYLAVSRAAFFS